MKGKEEEAKLAEEKIDREITEKLVDNQDLLSSGQCSDDASKSKEDCDDEKWQTYHKCVPRLSTCIVSVAQQTTCLLCI